MAITQDVIVTMVDGTVHKVRPRYADAAAWERTIQKHRWGTFAENVVNAQGFVAWRALKRDGVIGPDLTWEAWQDDVESIVPVDDDDAGPVPTRPGPIPG